MNVCGNCSSVETILPPKASPTSKNPVSTELIEHEKCKNRRSRLCLDCKELFDLASKESYTSKHSSRRNSYADSRRNSLENRSSTSFTDNDDKENDDDDDFEISKLQRNKDNDSFVSVPKSPSRSPLQDKNVNTMNTNTTTTTNTATDEKSPKSKLSPVPTTSQSPSVNNAAAADEAPFDPHSLQPKPLKIIITGPPGVGKRTQCDVIQQKFKNIYISVDNLLLEHIENNTDTSDHIQSLLEANIPLPDELITSLVYTRLKQTDCQTNGWILDGYPRTVQQANELTLAGYIPDCFLVIDGTEQVIFDRINGRRFDPITSKVYHMKYNPPETMEIADRLIIKKEDFPQNIQMRYKDFMTHFQSIYGFYEHKLWPLVVNGNRSATRICYEILSALNSIDLLPKGEKMFSPTPYEMKTRQRRPTREVVEIVEIHSPLRQKNNISLNSYESSNNSTDLSIYSNVPQNDLVLDYSTSQTSISVTNNSTNNSNNISINNTSHSSTTNSSLSSKTIALLKQERLLHSPRNDSIPEPCSPSLFPNMDELYPDNKSHHSPSTALSESINNSSFINESSFVNDSVGTTQLSLHDIMHHEDDDDDSEEESEVFEEEAVSVTTQNDDNNNDNDDNKDDSIVQEEDAISISTEEDEDEDGDSSIEGSPMINYITQKRRSLLHINGSFNNISIGSKNSSFDESDISKVFHRPKTIDSATNVNSTNTSLNTSHSIVCMAMSLDKSTMVNGTNTSLNGSGSGYGTFQSVTSTIIPSFTTTANMADINDKSTQSPCDSTNGGANNNNSHNKGVSWCKTVTQSNDTYDEYIEFHSSFISTPSQTNSMVPGHINSSSLEQSQLGLYDDEQDKEHLNTSGVIFDYSPLTPISAMSKRQYLIHSCAATDRKVQPSHFDQNNRNEYDLCDFRMVYDDQSASPTVSPTSCSNTNSNTSTSKDIPNSSLKQVLNKLSVQTTESMTKANNQTTMSNIIKAILSLAIFAFISTSFLCITYFQHSDPQSYGLVLRLPSSLSDNVLMQKHYYVSIKASLQNQLISNIDNTKQYALNKPRVSFFQQWIQLLQSMDKDIMEHKFY